MRPRGWLGSLGGRLLAAFVTVAVAAVALLATIAALSVDRHSAALAKQQRRQLRDDIASALATAYTAGQGTWTAQSLAALSALARAQGLRITVVDEHGQPVATTGEGGDGNHDTDQPHQPVATTAASQTPTAHSTAVPTSHAEQHPTTSSAVDEEHSSSSAHDGMHESQPADQHRDAADRWVGRLIATPTPTPTPASDAAPTAGNDTTAIPIVVAGRRVGTARFTFPDTDPAPVDAARSALLRQVALGAGLAVLLAVAASIFVARRVSRPLLALTGATRAFAAGNQQPDAGLAKAPGELGELGRAFTDMAATVRRQDELRRAVMADVAHELRTPITILRGQTEQLLDGIAEPSPERIVSLHDEILRLGRLTDDLATLAAADAAGLSLHTDAVELGALARRTAKAMQAHFADAELDLRVEADEPLSVPGDAERITQILTNLLTNAAKFTPPGGIVTVTVTRDGTNAVVTVTDTGPGMPEDELPHVFERFWRGRAAGARSGSGVGLAVVAALVHAHHGTVHADNPPGGGARFTVRLPASG